MTSDDREPQARPSLADRLFAEGKARAEAMPLPSSYRPALALLAAIPLVATLLACTAGLLAEHRATALAQAHPDRVAAHAVARRRAEQRVAMSPFAGIPTLTGELVDVAALLPGEAILHAVSREAGGAVRVQIDCPDPDTLIGAFRGSRRRWHAVAQSIAEGDGVRVTLETAP